MGLRDTIKAEWKATDTPRREPNADRLAKAVRLEDKAYGVGRKKR